MWRFITPWLRLTSLILALAGWGICFASPPLPTAYLEGLQVENLTEPAHLYRVSLALRNPGKLPLRLRRFSYHLDLNGSRFCEAEIPLAFILKPYSIQRLTAVTSSDLFNIVGHFGKVMFNRDLPLQYSLEGSFQLVGEAREIPVSAEGQITIEYPRTPGIAPDPKPLKQQKTSDQSDQKQATPDHQ